MARYLELYWRFLKAQEPGHRILKGTRAFLRSMVYYFSNRRVTSADYAAAYDAVSSTYSGWTELMGKHTDKIIKPGYLESPDECLEILDLACGQGYVTRKLLERWHAEKGEVSITAVDVSSGMLSRSRRAIQDPRVRFAEAEGIEFLQAVDPGTYHAVFFAWALPYFDHRKLIALLYRALKPGGVLALISNSKGTLADMEEIFVELMARYPGKVDKVPGVSFRLPDEERGLRSWFERDGFVCIESGKGEELVSFDSPQELYLWLCETGALAGTSRIFTDQTGMENLIVKKVAERRRVGDRYVINHRFVWGIFRKKV